MSTALFTQLVYDFNATGWNDYDLPKLSLRELEALARLLGCPHSGRNSPRVTASGTERA